MSQFDITKIKNKLNSLFKFDTEDQVDDLKKALSSSGAVIAGSAIMQSVLGVEWEDSDIDIWLPVSSQDSPVDSLCKATDILKCIPGDYNVPKIIKMCPRRHGTNLEQYQRLSAYVTYIMTMYSKTNNKKAIQIIFVKTTVQEVIASFDIIASQIWYNVDRDEHDEFLQILPNQFDHNDKPKSVNIIEEAVGDTPIIQLLARQIKMSEIALKLQSPFEWIRTIIRIEKYNTRFKTSIDKVEKQSIVQSIINKINIEHANSPENQYSLNVMLNYLHNFKAAWTENESCKKQDISVRWNDTLGLHVLEFRIQGVRRSGTIILNTNPIVIPPLEKRKIWTIDNYLITDDNEVAIIPDKNDNPIKETCFDFCTYDDEEIIKYLAENKKDNIVIFDASGEKPICYTRQRLTDLINTASTVFYPCLPQNKANKKKTLVRIHCQDYNTVVPISDVTSAIQSEQTIFRIYKTGTRFEITKSANVEYNVHDGSFVSGDHCQAGTNKNLYRLLDADSFKVSQSAGGKIMYTYNGLKYKLLIGKRGGKYIFVGEKKIYISEKDELINQIQNVRSRKANSNQAKKKKNKK